MKHGAQPHRPSGFTLVEILVVLAVIGILAGLLLPALARSRERGLGIVCLQNTRQLSLATQLYSDDHNGALPYNLSLSGDPLTAYRNNRNWVNDVMTWDLSPDNTNTQVITEAALG
ncbi:MAG TPA: type II secretion system protein, partial [Verrucomicrobiae bacterium]